MSIGHALVLHQVLIPDQKSFGPLRATKDLVRADEVIALDDKTLMIRFASEKQVVLESLF